VGTLAAGVAHEINNPLAYVIANLDHATLQLARARAEAERGALVTAQLQEVTDVLGDAREGGERIRNVVRDLKTFSRAPEEKKERIDVRRVLESSLNMAGNEIRHRARLVKDISDVPPVLGNESRLGQVF